jgi:cytochrome c553
MPGRMLRWTILLAVPLAAIAADAARQDLARVIASKPVESHGEELFQACAACHGSDGSGRTDGSVPRIAGQHYRVLARQIVDFRHGARWDMRMEGVATSHEVMPELQDIADVAWFVSLMKRDGAAGVRDGQYLQRGADIYAASCRSCHGTGGEGDGAKQVPRLAGQHASYLSRQIYDAVDGRRPPLATHRKRFAALDFEEVQGLTDYLARLD